MRARQPHGVLIALLTSASVGALAYEEPEFSVVATVNGIEFRRYEPYLVVETTVEEKDRDRAVNIGFRRLFGYISGDNVVRTEVRNSDADSTSTKIAMTVPVQQVREADGWTVSFVVPNQYEKDNVPVPIDSKVQIRPLRGGLTAVLRYSGRWSDENVAHHKAELISRLRDVGIAPRGTPVTAYYNAPFTLPFMRRNEVMVAVDNAPQGAQSAAD